MPTATDTQRVDVGALAGGVVEEARFRLSEAVSSFLSTLEDNGEQLSDKQTTYLLATVIGAFDRFDRKVAAELVGDLDAKGVRLWGLSPELADLQPAGGED